MENLRVVVPAAGPKTTHGRPLCLVRFGGEKSNSVLTRQLVLFARHLPHSHTVVVAGPHSNWIRMATENKGFGRGRVVENPDWERCNSARSVAIGLIRHNGPALIVYSDLVFSPPAIRQIVESPHSSLLVGNHCPMNEVGVNSDDFIRHVGYGASEKWLQIAYLTAEDVALFREIGLSYRGARLFTHEIFNDLIAKGRRLSPTRIKGLKIATVGGRADMRRAMKMLEGPWIEKEQLKSKMPSVECSTEQGER